MLFSTIFPGVIFRPEEDAFFSICFSQRKGGTPTIVRQTPANSLLLIIDLLGFFDDPFFFQPVQGLGHSPIADT